MGRLEHGQAKGQAKETGEGLSANVRQLLGQAPIPKPVRRRTRRKGRAPVLIYSVAVLVAGRASCSLLVSSFYRFSS